MGSANFLEGAADEAFVEGGELPVAVLAGEPEFGVVDSCKTCRKSGSSKSYYFDDAVGDFWKAGKDRCVVARDEVFGVGDKRLHALEGADEGSIVEGTAL
jgi:hypothetical protein